MKACDAPTTPSPSALRCYKDAEGQYIVPTHPCVKGFFWFHLAAGNKRLIAIAFSILYSRAATVGDIEHYAISLI